MKNNVFTVNLKNLKPQEPQTTFYSYQKYASSSSQVIPQPKNPTTQSYQNSNRMPYSETGFTGTKYTNKSSLGVL
jgi:hypothetical protein